MVQRTGNTYTVITPRLRLVPQGMAYVASTHAYASDASLTRYMLYLPNASEEDTRAFLMQAEADWQNPARTDYQFAVLLGERHIGGCSVTLLPEHPHEGELGWLLAADCHGRGYATEAAEGLKAFAFDTLGLRRLIAHCDARNFPSKRVMEKIGMTLERDDGERYDKLTGERVKELMYSLQREEDVIAETERLLIKRFDESMAEAVHRLSLDENNRRFQPDEVFETVADARETVQYLAASYGNSDAPQVYPVILKETGENIGHVELVPIGNGEWEIGYHIGEAFTRQGYASETVRAFLPVMAAKWQLPFIMGICAAENAASRAVMEKCGFVREFEGVGMYHGENRPVCRYRFTFTEGI